MIKKSIIRLVTACAILFLPEISEADDKIYTLENTGDYGIIVNDNEWIVTKGMATVKYHNRDTSVIRGEAFCVPMSFEFFSLFIPVRFQYAKNYLERYAFNTKTVFYISGIVSGGHSVLVRGSFLDNTSRGYFELYIVMDRRRNGRAFAIMSKIRFDCIDEEKRRELFAQVASMITPLVN